MEYALICHNYQAGFSTFFFYFPARPSPFATLSGSGIEILTWLGFLVVVAYGPARFGGAYPSAPVHSRAPARTVSGPRGRALRFGVSRARIRGEGMTSDETPTPERRFATARRERYRSARRARPSTRRTPRRHSERVTRQAHAREGPRSLFGDQQTRSVRRGPA